MKNTVSTSKETNIRDVNQMLKQREAELSLINSLQEAIVDGRTMQEIYELVGDRIRNLFDAQVAAVCTFDYEKRLEIFHYVFEDGITHKIDPRSIDKFRQRLIDKGELILINENADEMWTQITGEAPTVVPGTLMTKSALYVPMVVGKIVRGYLSLQNVDRENAFSDSDVKLLSTLANSMSIALENARLFTETEQRNAELAVINSVQQGLVAEMDMQGIYDLVGNRIRDLFDAQVTGIYTFDKDAGMEHFQYLFEDGERLYPESRPLNEIRKWIISNACLLHINENADDKVYEITKERHEPVPGTRLPKSLIFVPLKVGDEVRGCVSLQNLDREHAFSESDARLLSTLANSMSVALENARLFNETEQRNAELAVINSVQEGLVAEMDMQGIYDLVGNKIRDLFDSQVTGIATFNHETQTEDFQYIYENGQRVQTNPRPYDKIRRRLINTQKLINIEENAKEAYTTITGEIPKAVPGTGFAKSMVFVPLVVGDTVRGYVSLQNLDKEHAFSESDVRLLSTLANSMSIALENARLFNETEQRNAELAVINSVQAGLVAEMDMQGIYDLVGDKVRDLFDAQVTGVVTFDHEQKTEDWKYVVEDGERVYPQVRPYDKIREKIINEKSTLHITENAAAILSEIKGEAIKPVPGTRLAKSLLYVPMIVGEEVRGYLTLQNNDREHAFKDSDVRLLKTLTNSMSVALENARLFNETNRLLAETEQKNGELAVINSVQEGLVREMDMKAIYETVGQKICEVLNTQTLIIRTFDHEKELEIWEFAIENGKNIISDPRPFIWANKHLIASKEPLLINKDYTATSKKFGGTGVTKGKPPKSGIFVPMIVGDEVKGSISLQNIEKENAFSDSDVRLLTTLTNSMSVALENARLFNETEQRNAELAVINSVQQGLVAEMDMQGIYDLVGDRIRDLFDAQMTGIITFNHEEKTERHNYNFENGKRYPIIVRPIDNFRKKIIEEKETILLNKEVEQQINKINGKATSPVPGTAVSKSAVYVPMLVGETVRGYVTLQNLDRENAFSESDVRLLKTLTNSMSVALENARLFNETTRLLAETEQRATEMQTVNSISHALVSQLEFKALIKLIGDLMQQTFNADIVYLAHYDRKSNILNFPYMYGDEAKSRPFGNGITEKIIINREPLLVNQDLEKTYDRIEAERSGKWVESYLGVPIFAGNEAIGVISVQSTAVQNRFTDSDLRLLTTIAANVGVAMQNAEAYRKLQAAMIDLKSAQEQLVQQEKLASLGQLTAGIAHEIKNPLNFVNNFSDLNIELIDEVYEELQKLEESSIIKEVFEILTDLRSNLKKIHQHGKRADGIVKSMLQHSRGGSGKAEPTDLNTLIREYVNLSFHGMRAGKKAINVSIDLQLDENVGMVPLIGEDFSRVILNLCNNAFDAMRDKFNSQTGKNDYQPRLTVKTFQKNGNIAIQITDNGDGIPEEYKDKILQPFFTTKKGTEGTGLGLSITNDIIKAHKGSLDIISENGQYTSFNISIPNQN